MKLLCDMCFVNKSELVFPPARAQVVSNEGKKEGRLSLFQMEELVDNKPGTVHLTYLGMWVSMLIAIHLEIKPL